MNLKNINFYTERLCEVYHANQFFNKHNGDVIELGSVLYCWEKTLNEKYNKINKSYTSHTIIDKTEKKPFIINQDIIDTDIKDKNIICISTIEHTGYVDVHNSFEFGNNNKENPIIILNKIINDSKEYIITWPIGYCKYLDKYFFDNKEKYNYIIYITKGDNSNTWVPTTNIDEKTFYSLEYIIGNRFSKPNGVLILIGDNNEI